MIMILTVFSRYANMDFIAFYTLMGAILTSIIFSYDITCQQFQNIKRWMLHLLCEIWIPPGSFAVLQFFIPKLLVVEWVHLLALFPIHIDMKWSAYTNGEDPKWFWSHINPASLSIKEMTPSAQFDALDSHAVHWNWHKIVRFNMVTFMQRPGLDWFIFNLYRFIPFITITRGLQRVWDRKSVV